MARTRVYVHDRVISEMNLPGGDVWKLVRAIGKDTERIGKATAPVRTGRLRDSIELTGVTPLGTLGCQATVRVTADHAIYPIFGTQAWIYSSGKRMGPLWHQARGERSVRRHYVPRVRGQRANPFMELALRVAVGLHT